VTNVAAYTIHPAVTFHHLLVRGCTILIRCSTETNSDLVAVAFLFQARLLGGFKQAEK